MASGAVSLSGDKVGVKLVKERMAATGYKVEAIEENAVDEMRVRCTCDD